MRELKRKNSEKYILGREIDKAKRDREPGSRTRSTDTYGQSIVDWYI